MDRRIGTGPFDPLRHTLRKLAGIVASEFQITITVLIGIDAERDNIRATRARRDSSVWRRSWVYGSPDCQKTRDLGSRTCELAVPSPVPAGRMGLKALVLVAGGQMTENVLQNLKRVDFAQTEPLTSRLHGLIRAYPRGVGLIQEFVQNADDAGATVVSVWLDERTHASSRLPVDRMAGLQGPSIVVSNNACFTAQDWNRLQTIGQSGKSLDSSKTGRFGLGFNSVYNVTDFPCILSGDQIGVFDPHARTVAEATPQQPGSAWQLNDALWQFAGDLLVPFLSYGLADKSSHYDGTVFRLPLRTQQQAARSEVCAIAFTPTNFHEIVDNLGERVAELLLFLNCVTQIEFGRIDSAGNRTLLLSASTVNCEDVVAARSRVHQILEAEHSDVLEMLHADAGAHQATFTQEMQLKVGDVITHESWLVTRGLFLDPDGELLNCAREMFALKEKAVPLAGAASLLTSTASRSMTGRVFCGLPLPIKSPVKGCHLDGFFDLQSDRQGIFEDPEAGGGSAVRVKWNRTLIAHGCARALALHCTHDARARTGGEPSQYGNWPLVSVESRDLLDNLPRQTYARLSALECISTGSNREWRKPSDALIVSKRVADGLYPPLLADNFAVANPRLPDHVIDGFKACEQPVPQLTAQRLRDELRVADACEFDLSDPPRPCLSGRDWVIALLKHCTSDEETEDLEGVPLGLLASGRVCAFDSSRPENIHLAGAAEREVFATCASWFIDADIQSECGLKESAGAGIQNLTPQLVLDRLGAVLPEVGANHHVDPGECLDAPSAEWLTKVFHYLVEHHEHIQIKRDVIQELPLVPDQFGMLRVMGMASTPLLASVDDQSRLVLALRHFNVPIVDGDQELVAAIRKFVDTFPRQAIWRVDPVDVIDTLNAVKGPQHSDEQNVQFRREWHGVVLDYLAKRGVAALKGNASDRVAALQHLRLFPTATDSVVRLDDGGFYVPEGFELPPVGANIDLLDTGPKQEWDALYRALGVPTLTRSRLVREMILPRVVELDRGELVNVSRWMRQNLTTMREEEDANDAGQLIVQLGAELPVVCRDGEMRTPNALYHPDAEFVGALLGDEVGFPDRATYSDRMDLWLDFFEKLGMATTPRADDIVCAVDQVCGAAIAFSDKVERILAITEFLEDNWQGLQDQEVIDDDRRPDDTTGWSLSDALSHRAWLPALQAAPRGFPEALFAKPECEFFAPSDLLARANLSLVSSVNPVCALQRIAKMCESIGLRLRPELDEVLGQLSNICDRAERGVEGKVSDRVAGMFKSIYRYLGHSKPAHSEAEIERMDDVRELRERVHDLPCIVDESLRLWRPRQCFIEPVAHFLGRAARVRSTDHEVDRGIRMLGRRRSPELEDYRDLFDGLAADLEGAPVAHEELDRVRIAYRSGACSSDPSELIESPVLCADGRLRPSREVVLDDAPWISRRIRNAGVPMLESALDRSVAVAFGVQQLSVSVYEKPIREAATENRAFVGMCQGMQESLRSAEVARGVERLLVAAGTAVRRNDLASLFREISVKGVHKLESTLVWLDEGIPITGSEGTSDLVFDREQNTLIVDAEAEDVLEDLIADVMVRELNRKGYALGEMSGKFVAMLRVAPDRIARHLTKLHVPSLPDDAQTVELTDDASEGLIDNIAFDEDASADVPVNSHEETGFDQSSGTAVDELNAAPTTYGDGGTDVAKETPEDTGTGSKVGEAASALSGADGSKEVDGDGQQLDSDDQSHAGSTDAGRRPVIGLGGGQTGGMGTARPAVPSTRRSRSKSPSSGRGWIAVTRVKPDGHDSGNESPAKQEHRQHVDQAAIKRVEEYESKNGRTPSVMQHTNEGYDIESIGTQGEVERYIEVKGLSGAWTDFGVAISRAQHRKAIREKASFWLYVVEFALEPDRSKVFAIQDPAGLIDQYWFDDGWKLLSREQDGLGTGTRPWVGASVLVDGKRSGHIKTIRAHGALQQFQIEFSDESVEWLVYTPRRIQLVDGAGE